MKSLLSLLGRYLLTLSAVAVATLLAFILWKHYVQTPWTRDGRVRADVVQIAPDVSGPVLNVAVRDNQWVNRGDVLYSIDPHWLRLAVVSAQADVEAKRHEMLMRQDAARRRSQIKGVISSVTGFGFFVRLDELFIDGLVHVSSLDNDYYRFDQVGQRLMGESSGQTYRLGDRVEVRVEAVNMDERKIDFSLISSERAPRNVGKTAREKAKRGETAKNAGKRRQVGKKVNFEPDSAFRGEKAKGKAKKEKKAKNPSAKTQKIAAATKAKRAAKKKSAE